MYMATLIALLVLGVFLVVLALSKNAKELDDREFQRLERDLDLHYLNKMNKRRKK